MLLNKKEILALRSCFFFKHPLFTKTKFFILPLLSKGVQLCKNVGTFVKHIGRI